MVEHTGEVLLAGHHEISDLHKRTYGFLKKKGRNIFLMDYKFEGQVDLSGVHFEIQIRSVTHLLKPVVFIAVRSGDFSRLIAIKDGRKNFALVENTTLDDLATSGDMSDHDRKMFNERSHSRPASKDDVAVFKDIILLLDGDRVV